MENPKQEAVSAVYKLFEVFDMEYDPLESRLFHTKMKIIEEQIKSLLNSDLSTVSKVWNEGTVLQKCLETLENCKGKNWEQVSNIIQQFFEFGQFVFLPELKAEFILVEEEEAEMLADEADDDYVSSSSDDDEDLDDFVCSSSDDEEGDMDE
jgi:NCAIR mutase (PurE)-related protein